MERSKRKKAVAKVEKIFSDLLPKLPSKIMIGIDPGTETGIAIYDPESKKIISIYTLNLGMSFSLIQSILGVGSTVFVICEDARKRKGNLPTDKNRLQGAGSIKCESKVWEQLLDSFFIPHLMTKPSETKMNPSFFEKMTGYRGRSSNHGRDAAMKVFGITLSKADLLIDTYYG